MRSLARIKRKVLDTMESGVSAAMHLDMTKAVGTVMQQTGVVAKPDAWAEDV